MNDLLRLAFKIAGLLFLVLIVLSCLPVLLIVLLFLAITGNVGMAKNVIWTRTAFGQARAPGEDSSGGPSGAGEDEDDTIEAEVINAETIVDGAEKTDAAGHSKNTFLE